MKTLRNLAVTVLLALAAVVINNQSAQAFPIGCNQARQQCAIVPGGGVYEDYTYCGECEFGYVVIHGYHCHRDPDDNWGGGECWEDAGPFPEQCQP